MLLEGNQVLENTSQRLMLRRRKVTLRNSKDGSGTRNLTARLTETGLVIEGHDLGAGVEGAFGASEYEWIWTVATEHLSELEEHLGGPVLATLKARYSGDNAVGIHAMLQESGVPIRGGSRTGD